MNNNNNTAFVFAFQYGSTALMNASSKESVDVVRLLLLSGANANAVNSVKNIVVKFERRDKQQNNSTNFLFVFKFRVAGRLFTMLLVVIKAQQ